MEIEEKRLKQLFIVAITAIVVRGDGRMLIMKRSAREVAFPSKWTVPGGKLHQSDFAAGQKTKSYEGAYGILEPAVKREVKEEADIEIDDVQFLPSNEHNNYGFIRPDSFNVLGLSFWARYKSGEVKLPEDLTDHAWVSLEEAKGFDLIEGIWDELRQVDDILEKTQEQKA